MTNTRKIFAYELTNWLIYVTGFKKPQYQMYIHYEYAPDGSKLVLLSYVDDCVYCYTPEEIGNWFVDIIGKRFHVNFLGCAHLFMSIRISQLKEYSISVDQYRYVAAVVSKYLDTATTKENTKYHKTTLPHDIGPPKEDA